MNAATAEPGSNRPRRLTFEEEVEQLRATLERAQLNHAPPARPAQPATHGLPLSHDDERDTLGARALLAAMLHRAIMDYLMGYTYTGKTKVEEQLQLAQDAEDWLWCRGPCRGDESVTSAPMVCFVLKVDLSWVRRFCTRKLAALRAGEGGNGTSLDTAVRNRRRAGHDAPDRRAVLARARRHQRS